MKDHGHKHGAGQNRHKNGVGNETAGGDKAADAIPADPAAPVNSTPAPEENKTPTEVEKLKDQLVRLAADFDNFRKRTQRDQQDMSLRANEAILKDLLPVIDHFELGLETARKKNMDAAVLDGFKLVYDQIMTVLGRHGVSPVHAEGQPFDPNLHEAITYIPSNEHPADVVMTQTRRGYKLGERLLRPAQGVVSSGPASAQPADADTEATGE